MEYGIISCIPITVLIVGVLITKRMAEMMILASVLGAILVHKAGFFGGWIDMLYASIANPSYDFLLFILLGFGALIKLFEESGAFLGFSSILSKVVRGPKSAMVATWIMGIIMFVDDYLNVLAVSTSMKTITDKNDIPREHLAYGVNSMGACVCVLIPISSWAMFATGIISEQGLGFSDYLRSLPYMFFPIISIVVCLLVAVGIIPKVGPIKKAYERVEAGGPLIPEASTGASIINLDNENPDKEVEPGSPWFFIVPVVVLVVVMFIRDSDVISGIIAAIIAQAVMYIGSRRMTLTNFIDNFLGGLTSMAGLAFIILNAYIMGMANDEMGFTTYIIGIMTKAISPQLLPALSFLIVAFVAFAAASFWVLIVITVPIFVPLAISMGIDPALVIAGIMSGVAFGSKFCFYSDAVFMTSAGTGVSNMTQIKAVAPYVLGSAILATILFVIMGFIIV
jgi:tetracycline resistance efflux pump